MTRDYDVDEVADAKRGPVYRDVIDQLRRRCWCSAPGCLKPAASLRRSPEGQHALCALHARDAKVDAEIARTREAARRMRSR